MTDREGRFENFPADPDGSGMPRLIGVIVEDLAGTLWLGSWVDGLARFDPVTGKIESFRHDVRDTTSLSDDFVSGIVVRRREPGIVWVATGGSGLNRLDIATGTFRLFDESDGLANNSLYAMLEDETGQLWLSSNRGLSRFNPETETFRNYGLEIGLQSLEFNLSAAYKSRSGELFFGGINGLNAF